MALKSLLTPFVKVGLKFAYLTISVFQGHNLKYQTQTGLIATCTMKIGARQNQRGFWIDEHFPYTLNHRGRCRLRQLLNLDTPKTRDATRGPNIQPPSCRGTHESSRPVTEAASIVLTLGQGSDRAVPHVPNRQGRRGASLGDTCDGRASGCF